MLTKPFQAGLFTSISSPIQLAAIEAFPSDYKDYLNKILEF